MNKESLAVIMSIYAKDEAQYVSQAIESILNQSYQDFGFYILLDGPVQKDVELYLDCIKDKRVHLYSRDNNLGLAKSLNELLSIVLGKGIPFIARMDADDISLPTRFEKQLSFLYEHPIIDCVGTWAIEIKANGDEFYRKMMPETHEECRKQFMIRDCLIHPTVMFRQSFFEKAGFYALDTYFGEDTMMWAQGFANNCIYANIPEYLFKFRLNDDFFNRRRGWKHAKGILALRWKVNRMLNFPLKAYIYAIAYAGMKMMPTRILSYLYRCFR